MFTIISILSLFILIFCVWKKNKKNITELSLIFICLAPFLALPSLINHNLDNDIIHPFIRMAPFIFMNILLSISLIPLLKRKISMLFWTSFFFLSIYSVISFLQIPFSSLPVWSFFTWGMTIPGFFFFLYSGYFTSVSIFYKSSLPFWAIIGFIFIGIFLRVFGMISGRVHDIWLSRNFGSVFASGIIILALYSGMAWLRIWKSRKMMFIFLFCSILSLASSMSRSAVIIMILILILIGVSWYSNRNIKISVLLFLIVASFLSGIYLNSISNKILLQNLYSGWETRFSNALNTNWAIESLKFRLDEFSWARKAVTENHIITGVGFGQFYFSSNSGYQDAHNLFITEAYENGLVATIFLYGFLFIGIFAALKALLKRRTLPLGLSVLAFLLILHTGGYTLSERGSPAAYYSTYFGWALCFLIGIMLNPKKLSPAKKPDFYDVNKAQDWF